MLRNLKIISSVLYYAIIEPFVALPKISKDIRPVDASVGKKKSFFSGKSKSETSTDIQPGIEAKKKKFEKYDPLFDKEYSNFHNNKKDKITLKEEELMKELNEKLPTYSPDSKLDDLEFIRDKLCSKEELKDYYELAKKNKYNLSSKIKAWSERLLNLVIKQLDDVNGDNDTPANDNENNQDEEEMKKDINDEEDS
jgi:hypothetical protein